MKLVPPTAVTGKDATLPSRQEPPKELTEAMGMPIPPALKTAQNQEVS
jgi:NAD(P)H-quinone oxidoreductase subunit K